MLKTLYLVTFCISALLATGCAGTIPTDTYIPQNYVRYENKNHIDIGNFAYLPAQQTSRAVKSNQIQNTAIGSIFISTDVSEVVRRATALELEKTGIIINDKSNIRISGDVLELKADDLGYSVHWTYGITYRIFNKDSDSIIFLKEYWPTMKKTGKFGLASTFTPVIYEVVLSGYDMFIRDQAVRDILDKPSPY